MKQFLATLAFALLCWISLPASTRLMPLEEIRPGMTGIGRTVFQGYDLQEFKVHVLGVLRNVQGPRRSLILARLEGGPLAETGVAAGMSGSPVYVDGRLVGAVGYAVGSFPKEAIAGITPIEEMTDATQRTRRAPGQQARIDLPITREGLAAALSQVYARIAPFAARPADVQAIGLPAATGAQLGAMLRPIATPLVLGGFEPATADLISSAFREAGFVPVLAGGMSAAEQKSAPRGAPREGDAVGVALVGGDLEMGATGTITYIDGDRVYAFGHPFFNLGPSEFPMTRAHVYAMLPSLMSSFKITSMGEVIGTMTEDRATAIAGTLGQGPGTIPLKVTLDSQRGGGAPIRRTFTYSIGNDQTLTPLLTYVAMFNTISAYERQFGAATFTVKGRARVKGHNDIALDDVFTGETPTTGVAAAVAGPLTMLLANDREPVAIDGMAFTIEATESPRTVTIERVWLDEIRPRPGRTVPLKILTRSYRGEEKISTLPIEIPANVSGPLSVMVSDGRQLNAIEQRDLRRSLQPQSVAQMIRALNETRRNTRIYVRLLTGTPGAVVNGEALTALPPSVLTVLEGDRNGGSYTPLRSAPVGEWEIPMDSAVSGSRVLAIEVDTRSGGR